MSEVEKRTSIIRIIRKNGIRCKNHFHSGYFFPVQTLRCPSLIIMNNKLYCQKGVKPHYRKHKTYYTLHCFISVATCVDPGPSSGTTLHKNI